MSSTGTITPRNPLFYVSTFVNNEAAGLLPYSQVGLNSLVATMQSACYGKDFDGARCSLVSQMVGKVRTQDACAHDMMRVSHSSAAPVAPYLPVASASRPAHIITPSVLTATGFAPGSGPSGSSVTAALAALGASSDSTTLAIC